MLILSACSSFIVGTDPKLKPTQGFDSEQAKHLKASSEILSQDIVIVDARVPFEFAVSHIPGSVNIFWQDYSMPKGPQEGYVDSDLNSVIRRLATLGISPETPILIVGNFNRNKGEAGRVAWMFKYLGISNIKLHDVNDFLSKKGTLPDKPRANKDYWQVQPQTDWLVEKDEFQSGMYLPKVKREAPVIIDARSEKEYLAKGKVARPDVGAINIPHAEFYKTSGQINFEILPKLQAIGLAFDKKIWVISDHGVRSAAVTYALRELGFQKAANYAGGYHELFGADQK